jgi:DUF2924 family protein
MQHKLSQVRPHELARELAVLPNLDVTALKQRWHSLYRTEPPARISRSLLFQAVAYRLQEQALGGLKSSTRRVLERVAREANTRLSITEPPTRLSPGTVLVREWHGVNYRDGARRWGAVPRQALSLAPGGGAPDHWDAMVGTALLWAEGPDKGDRSWSPLSP